MPKISVIVPVYNTEKYLPACLNALLAQTVKDIEIIAVNNGCTDGCTKILEKYASMDQRIRVITKPHGNIYTARNMALRAAKGVWVAFCDSDDTVPPKAYEYMIKKTKKISCDVVVGGYIEVDESGEKILTSLPHSSTQDFDILMSTPCVWNKVIRREFLTEHNLEFPPVPIEDIVFLERLLRCSPRIAHINRPIYYYWQHYFGEAASLSYRYTSELFKGLLQSHYIVYKEMIGTQYQSNAEEYVYCSLASTLKDFLPRIWDNGEREVCYELFRRHLLAVSWEGREDRFLKIFEIPLTEFRFLSAEKYIKKIMALNHRKSVLMEYRAGTIGLQYIYIYFKAWLKYKLKRVFYRKKKDVHKK